MAFTRDWLEVNPIDHSKFKTQPESVRDFKVDISDRLKDFLYGFATGETDIGAKSIPFISQGTAAPDTAANQISLYSNDVSGKAEIFAIDEDGNVIQITKSGKIPMESLSIGSGTAGDIFYHNGTSVARLGKGTDGDLLTLTTGLPSWAAPTPSVPSGAISMWGGALASPPSGWLVCNGAQIDKTTYAALFAVIGHTFAADPGSNKFTLPNFTNVFPYGANEGASAGNASVGSRNTCPAGGTSAGMAGNDNALSYKIERAGISGDSGAHPPYLSDASNILPPYIAVGFIIKT